MTNDSRKTDEDQGLSILIKQGDKQAFSRLYDKYAPALMGIITRIAKDEKLAEEILKLTFIKIWNQAAGYNASHGSFFSWLITISRQTAFEEIRSHQVKTPPGQTPVNRDKKADRPNPSTSDSPTQPSPFDLIYYQGLSCKEAAVALNITVDELKTIVRKTIKNMKTSKSIC